MKRRTKPTSSVIPKPYTVLLLYPRHMTDGEIETWLGHVNAPNPDAAIAEARAELEPNEVIDDAADADAFEAIMVLDGHVNEAGAGTVSPPHDPVKIVVEIAGGTFQAAYRCGGGTDIELMIYDQDEAETGEPGAYELDNWFSDGQTLARFMQQVQLKNPNYRSIDPC